MLKEEMNCEHVFNSKSENFFEEVTKLAKELKATALIECVGGDFLG